MRPTRLLFLDGIMRVLLVFPEKKIRGMLLLALDGKYRVTAKVVDTAGQAIAILDVLRAEFDLIIADYATCAEELMKYQETAKKKNCWLFWRDMNFSGYKIPDSAINVQEMSSMDPMELLYVGIESLLPDMSKTVAKSEPTDFCRISAPLLVATSPLRADVFIGLSDKKFIKIFKEVDTFEPSDLEKYHHRIH